MVSIWNVEWAPRSNVMGSIECRWTTSFGAGSLVHCLLVGCNQTEDPSGSSICI